MVDVPLSQLLPLSQKLFQLGAERNQELVLLLGSEEHCVKIDQSHLAHRQGRVVLKQHPQYKVHEGLIEHDIDKLEATVVLQSQLFDGLVTTLELAEVQHRLGALLAVVVRGLSLVE